MKKPDEIKKGMQHCLYNDFANYGCKGCPYQLPGGFSRMHECQYDVVKDVYSLIQQLEADNSRLNDTIRSLTDQLNAAHDETAKAILERDAAVDDLASVPRCKVCANLEKDNYEEPCDSCAHIAFMGDIRGNWEWRGVCPENTEVHVDE